ncbi:MAG: hypothetical protein Q9169_008529, partial [Polycauliona sp. 2 TL-2023]
MAPHQPLFPAFYSKYRTSLPTFNISTQTSHFMSTSPLPKTRHYLTSLFASFPQEDPHTHTTNHSPQPQPLNPLSSASPAVKTLLLTLHVLFPNELLPALDLLDRRLVVRLVLDTTPLPNSTKKDDNNTINENITNSAKKETSMDPSVSANTKGRKKKRIVYYVRSSQQPRFHRFASASSRTYDALASNNGGGQSYE